MSMQKKKKEKRIFITGCHLRGKNGGKRVTILKRHLDSFKNANIVSQAPKYI